MVNSITNLGIMISGQGSNAKNLITNYLHQNAVKIQVLISTKPNEPARHFAENHDVAYVELCPWHEPESIDVLRQHDVDVVVLAGFLRKISTEFILAFPKGILNLHPSLLPKYGGKGMYGHHVHQKVFENKERTTGITIHLVNEHYDEGEILAQFTCVLEEFDDPTTIANKIQELEHRHFPEVVLQFCKRLQGAI
jgi:phosphoribosylglycinamide formyltransferase-1